MSAILALFARHWKTALVAILLAGAGLYGWWEHHEAAKYHAQVITIQQAERDATAQAKAEQAKADQNALRQAQALAEQKKAEIATLQQAKAQASQKATQALTELSRLSREHPKVKAWSETPIPASVLSALKGGGL